jgi:predicted molibdopterin-dependent oxidoreductase YjgC
MTARDTVVEFVLDGRRATGGRGEMLLPAARRAGADIPSLCHVDGIEPYAACRVCLVEVDDGRGPEIVTACDLPLREGLRVRTTGRRLDRLRGNVIRLHMARAPASREVQRLARRFGVDGTGGLRIEDPTQKCILCGLCVRVCGQIVGAHALGGAGRGAHKRVGPAFEEDDARECIGCGACAWVCPSRCIEMEPIAIERLRSRWGERRVCRYALLGLTPGALCTHDYECASCPVDHEMFDRAGGRHPAFLLDRGGERP